MCCEASMHACSATKSCEVFGVCEVFFETHLNFCKVFLMCCEVCMHVYKFVKFLILIL